MAANLDLTDRAQRSLQDAVQLARDHANSQVYPAHIAFALLNDNTDNNNTPLFSSIISSVGGDPHAAKRTFNKLIVRFPQQSPPPDDIGFSVAALKILRDAQSIQKTMHDSYIALDHLILALLKDPSISAVLKDLSLTENALKTAIEQVRGNRRIDSKSAEAGFDALQKYAVDLTALAEEGKLDPVIGRDNEIRRAIRILCRRYVTVSLIFQC
jgi:ATP-dependent Clp protease ATP-binding subunit ClpB